MIVDPRCQGRRIGYRMMQILIDKLAGRSILLHSTPEGRGLYERFGFVRSGEVRQHQGTAQPAPLVALADGWRLRPLNRHDRVVLCALDAEARGMPRDRLIGDLIASVKTVVLDHAGKVRGFAMVRRFGRGLVIGPVVAPDAESAKALMAHLIGISAGKFVRVDVDFDSGLTQWLEDLGLERVDAPPVMVRNATPASRAPARLYALITQALG